MKPLTISKEGRIYAYLNFLSWEDRCGIKDTCGLVRRLLWVTTKIAALCAFEAWMVYCTVVLAIVTAIGLQHGLSIQESARLCDPLIGFFGMLILVVPIGIGVLVGAAGLMMLGDLVTNRKTSFSQSLRKAAENSEAGRLLLTKTDKICVPVEFK